MVSWESEKEFTEMEVSSEMTRCPQYCGKKGNNGSQPESHRRREEKKKQEKKGDWSTYWRDVDDVAGLEHSLVSNHGAEFGEGLEIRMVKVDLGLAVWKQQKKEYTPSQRKSLIGE